VTEGGPVERREVDAVLFVLYERVQQTRPASRHQLTRPTPTVAASSHRARLPDVPPATASSTGARAAAPMLALAASAAESATNLTATKAIRPPMD